MTLCEIQSELPENTQAGVLQNVAPACHYIRGSINIDRLLASYRFFVAFESKSPENTAELFDDHEYGGVLPEHSISSDL